MSRSKRAPKKKLDGSIITLIAALLTLVGTMITAYFGFRASSRPLEVSIIATQTAESKATEQSRVGYEATVQAKLLPTVFAQVNSTMQAQNTNQKAPTVDTSPLLIFLHTNPERLLSSDSQISDAEREKLLSEFFDLLPSSYQNRKSAIVVAIGFSNSTSEGQKLARYVYEIIQADIPEIFSDAVLQSYGYEPSENEQIGIIRLEIYFFH